MNRDKLAAVVGVPFFVAGIGVIVTVLEVRAGGEVGVSVWLVLAILIGGVLGLLGLGVMLWGFEWWPWPQIQRNLPATRKELIEETEAEVESALETATREKLEQEREQARIDKEARLRDRTAAASVIDAPRGKTVYWDWQPKHNGAEASFWVLHDQQPHRMSLGFRFVRPLKDPVDLWIDEEIMHPTVDNDPTLVVVQFETPPLKPGMMGRLRVLSEDGEPLGVPPVGGWHY